MDICRPFSTSTILFQHWLSFLNLHHPFFHLHPFWTSNARYGHLPPILNINHPFWTSTARFEHQLHPPPFFHLHNPFRTPTTLFSPSPPFSNIHHPFFNSTANKPLHCPFSAPAARFQPPTLIFHPYGTLPTTRFLVPLHILLTGAMAIPYEATKYSIEWYALYKLVNKHLCNNGMFVHEWIYTKQKTHSIFQG